MAAEPHAPPLSGRRRTWAFSVVAIAFVMDLLDVTIVNVALPSIGQALGAGAAHSAWIVAGYALAFAVLLVLGGRLGDLLGHRRLFLWGVAAFTTASLACGLAPGADALVAARVAQGACAAMMVPQVMALMQWLYAPHERMRAFTLFGLLGGVSSALGPVLGGLLVDADVAGLGWRGVFLINLPVGLFAVLAGARLLPADAPSAHTTLDLPGTAWCLAAALAWSVPLMQGPEQGWTAPLALLLASAPAWSWGLWRHCQRLRAAGGEPIIQPALLADAGYRRGLGVSLLCTGVVPAHLFVLTFAWQLGAGVSATRMALLCLPIALGVMASVSWLGRQAFARWGTRCIALGLALQALGIGAMALLAVGAWGDPLAQLLAAPGLLAQALVGLGVGFVGPPLTAVTLQGVPRAQAGGASGVVNAARQFAAVAWVAAVAALIAGVPAAPDAVLLAALPALAAALALGAWASFHLPAPAR